MLQAGSYCSALAAAAYWGRVVEITAFLVEVGAEVNLKLENGLFVTTLQASEMDMSREDVKWIFYDPRTEETVETGEG